MRDVVAEATRELGGGGSVVRVDSILITRRAVRDVVEELRRRAGGRGRIPRPEVAGAVSSVLGCGEEEAETIVDYLATAGFIVPDRTRESFTLPEEPHKEEEGKQRPGGEAEGVVVSEPERLQPIARAKEKIACFPSLLRASARAGRMLDYASIITAFYLTLALPSIYIYSPTLSAILFFVFLLALVPQPLFIIDEGGAVIQEAIDVLDVATGVEGPKQSPGRSSVVKAGALKVYVMAVLMNVYNFLLLALICRSLIPEESFILMNLLLVVLLLALFHIAQLTVLLKASFSLLTREAAMGRLRSRVLSVINPSILYSKAAGGALRTVLEYYTSSLFAELGLIYMQLGVLLSLAYYLTYLPLYISLLLPGAALLSPNSIAITWALVLVAGVLLQFSVIRFLEDKILKEPLRSSVWVGVKVIEGLHKLVVLATVASVSALAASLPLAVRKMVPAVIHFTLLFGSITVFLWAVCLKNYGSAVYLAYLRRLLPAVARLTAGSGTLTVAVAGAGIRELESVPVLAPIIADSRLALRVRIRGAELAFILTSDLEIPELRAGVPSNLKGLDPIEVCKALGCELRSAGLLDVLILLAGKKKREGGSLQSAGYSA